VKHAQAFFDYAIQRELIRLRREEDEEGGEPQGPPWTNDPILQQFRFCNVFREDDKVTRWMKENVRDRYAGDPRLLQAVTIARWFNRPSTLERLLDGDLLINWDADEVRRRLESVSPLVTGAYMIKTPAKMTKLEGLLWCIEHVVRDAPWIQDRIQPGFTTLRQVTERMATFPYLGTFMGYEIACDLRYTELLSLAPDRMSWANPGPGATRGIARVWDLPIDHYNRHSQSDYSALQMAMQSLLKASKVYWPKEMKPWEMREVEHTLCEFDKYERVRLGQGVPKQRFNGS
jgi:hypothetical protein